MSATKELRETIIYEKGTVVGKALGVSSAFLRKAAKRGELPDGSVLCTPGGHMSFDRAKVLAWMQENYKRLTRAGRMEAATHRKRGSS